MKYTYYPKNVCSGKFEFEIENGIVKNLSIAGGCSGNLQGICRLAEGKDAADLIRLLEGIKCGYKKTSCPDQLAKAFSQALENSGNNT